MGLPEEYFIPGMQPEVDAAVRKAVAHLESLGATIVPISLPNTDKALPVYYLVATAEASANLARYDGVRFGYSAGRRPQSWRITANRGARASVLKSSGASCWARMR